MDNQCNELPGGELDSDQANGVSASSGPEGANARGPMLLEFADLMEAGRYFQGRFEEGDRRRTEFRITNSPAVWEVINQDIPCLRLARPRPAPSDTPDPRVTDLLVHALGRDVNKDLLAVLKSVRNYPMDQTPAAGTDDEED